MALLTGISLENFKGISNRVNIPLRPLTLLFGANSAGKSTVLHSLLYIREVIRTGNVDIDRLMQGGASIDLGGFKNLVHAHDTSRTMRIRFDLDYSNVDLTKHVEIDEFLFTIGSDQNQSKIDLSTIGDSVESGWIEFHIGTGTNKHYPPRVLYWEVGFDGIWFAKVGNWVTREDFSLGIPPDQTATAILNEVHPLLALPKDEEKTGNIYGGISESTRTEYYELYFSEDYFTLPKEFKKDELFQLLSHHHGEKIAKEYHEYIVETFTGRELFIEDTLRAALDPEGNSVIEFGILKEDGGLGLYRGISRGTTRSRYLTKINSIDRCPELHNMRGCIPDWEKQFKTGWPLSFLKKFEVQEGKNDLNQDKTASVHFLEQVIERLCIGPLLLVKDELTSLRYIGPVRDIVPRNFKAPQTIIDDRWANGFAAWDTLYRDVDQVYDSGIDQTAGKERMLLIDKPDEVTLIEKTSEYLNEKLGLNYSLYLEKSFILPIDHPIVSELDLLASRYEEKDAQYFQSKITSQFCKLEKINKIKIIDERNGVTVEPDDIGVGVSQVIPVIVGSLEKSAPILAVEQPELHVHPAVACNLGDLFIREFVKQKRLCLIETHSEHLVLRLLRRIRETTNKPQNFDESLALSVDDISVITVENNEGAVSMVEIPVREDGEFSRKWPKGFFEEREEELF